MTDNQRFQVERRMPINRRVGLLDKVLTDAILLYLRVFRPWRGGERGDVHMLEETDENHSLVDESARLFKSDLAKAAENLIERLELIRGEDTSDPRKVSR